MSVQWKHYNHMLPQLVMRSIAESGVLPGWLAILAVAMVLYLGN